MSKKRLETNRFRSVRDFYREGRHTQGYSLFDFIHGYVYARWPYLYIGIGTGEHPLVRLVRPLLNFFSRVFPGQKRAAGGQEILFEDTYHGKVVLPETAADLVSVQEDISLEDLEPVIPYAKARDLILRDPDHIVTLDCPCRVSRPDPCLPLDVCLIIGEPFASFVREHHPQRSRWVSGEEALDILRAEHERGHVHHAFFKDAMLERFYAICNCCSCCCGAMQAQRNGTLMLTSSGYVAAVAEALCEGCGTCEEICPFQAIHLTDTRAVLEWQACMGCGICVDHCPEGAIQLEYDPQKGEPLDLFSAQEKTGAEAGPHG